jgi:hypothetical protein
MGSATRLRQGYGVPSIEHVAIEGMELLGEATWPVTPRGSGRARRELPTYNGAFGGSDGDVPEIVENGVVLLRQIGHDLLSGKQKQNTGEHTHERQLHERV